MKLNFDGTRDTSLADIDAHATVARNLRFFHTASYSYAADQQIRHSVHAMRRLR